jgi:peptide/nickel transport system permease protein
MSSATISAPTLERTVAVTSWRRRLFGGKPDPIFAAALLVVLIAIVCALIPGQLAPYLPAKMSKDLLQAPSRHHLLGTDEFGRDILSRIIHGARIELVISVLGVALALVLGLPLGLIAGYWGGFVDSVLMRLQDALLAFPAVLFAILVVAAMGASRNSIVLTIGVIYLPRFARLVRGNVLVLKNEDFVIASRAAGASSLRIVFRHILPNCLASILVQITLAMAVAVLIEAGLSYLGLGVQPPTATWGTMLKSAQSYPRQAPWYVFAPGASIFVLVLALNTVGDALRDRLDPRLRRL